MFEKINHVIVRVGNVEKAVRFWTEKVGLKVKERDGEWVEFELRGTTLALLERSGGGKAKDTGINFWVEDVSRVYDELAHAGVRFETPPKSRPWGGALARFLDEEGNIYTIEGPE